MTGRYIRCEIARKEGRERRGEERRGKQGIERERGRERRVVGGGNEETKCRSKECRSKDEFLTDTSNCTENITTKLLIMHGYKHHLLSTPSGEVFVTRLQNDAACIGRAGAERLQPRV